VKRRSLFESGNCFVSKLINFAYCHKVAASVFKMVGSIVICGALP
jgi:hypothetical protein